jgi:hypothetical protein
MGDYPTQPVAVMFYGIVMALAGASFSWMRYYVFFVGRLRRERIDRLLIKRAMMKSVLNPLLHTAAVLVALVNTKIAIGFYVAIPILFFIPSNLERHVATS